MLDLFQRVLGRLREECLSARYAVLLEADLYGWLFHLLVTESEVAAEDVHLDTRVSNGPGHFDVALGPVGTRSDGRPCVIPRLVAEVKVFPRLGFSASQHRKRYLALLEDDLPRLGSLDPSPDLAALLVLDGPGYLEGTYDDQGRRGLLTTTRDRAAPDAHLFIVRLTGGQWRVEHEPPA